MGIICSPMVEIVGLPSEPANGITGIVRELLRELLSFSGSTSRCNGTGTMFFSFFFLKRHP